MKDMDGTDKFVSIIQGLLFRNIASFAQLSLQSHFSESILSASSRTYVTLPFIINPFFPSASLTNPLVVLYPVLQSPYFSPVASLVNPFSHLSPPLSRSLSLKKFV